MAIDRPSERQPQTLSGIQWKCHPDNHKTDSLEIQPLYFLRTPVRFSPAEKAETIEHVQIAESLSKVELFG
jgi:hypothetical protein